MDKSKKTSSFVSELIWDSTKPDGTPKKLLDVSKINTLGLKEKVVLENGIIRVYKQYCN